MCCEEMRVLRCVEYMEEDLTHLTPNPECEQCYEEFDVNELLVRDPQIS